MCQAQEFLSSILSENSNFVSRSPVSTYWNMWNVISLFSKDDGKWPEINITKALCMRSSVSHSAASTEEVPLYHEDVIKWKDFLRYWPFVRGIHRSPVNYSQKGQWCGALIFPLRLNKRLSKQPWGWWSETPWRPLWRLCNVSWYLVNHVEWSRHLVSNNHKRYLIVREIKQQVNTVVWWSRTFSCLHNSGRDSKAAISQTTFLNAFSWMKIYECRLQILLKFVPKCPISNTSTLEQIMAWCCPGDKPLSEPLVA